MKYKGYTASTKYSDEDGVFFGVIENIKDSISFESDDADGLEEAFHEAVDEYEHIKAKSKRDKTLRVVNIITMIFLTISMLIGIGLAFHYKSVGEMGTAIYYALIVIGDILMLNLVYRDI